MECISISFKSAPEEVRKCFVFSEEEKRKILEQTSQAVVLNTCNRTEIYVTGGENSFSLLERLLADKSGMEETQLRRISRRFQGKKALEHLYRVTCGMDSMVLGEDEIRAGIRKLTINREAYPVLCGSAFKDKGVQPMLDAAGEDAFVIGGESVYRALLDRCGTAYVTKILAQYPADRYFPDLDADPRWESVEESELLEENGVRFRYVTYRRRQEA